ncbi:hypothetical protein ACTFIR_008877 [Dictyostelium discoideum]
MNKSILLLVLVIVSIIGSIESKKVFNVRTDLKKQLKFRHFDDSLDYDAINYQWFTQSVDHFNPANPTTFQQRYLINDQYWDGTGPVFIMINGEGPMDINTVTQLQFVVWAKQVGALVVSLEHRYYGASFVTEDLSLENLQWLNSAQALADNAVFRNFVEQEYNVPKGSKWISFGGSYSGALTSWFRIKYPHLVDATIASSAPVNPEVNFYQYLETVQTALLASKSNGNLCVENINIATQKIQALLSQDNYGGVDQMFNLCAPLGNQNDVATFMQSLAGNFMGVVQYNDEEPGQIDIDYLCNIMTNQSSDPLTNYIQIWDQYADGECVDVSYASMIAQNQNVTNDENAIGGRMWFYQTCVEFGYYQSSDAPSANQPFGNLFPFQPYQIQQCADSFGIPNMYPNVNWTITEYGGINPEPSSVDNTLYVNGSNDEWHNLAILPGNTNAKNTLYIIGTSHCADMMIPTSVSPPTLAQAQQIIFEFIQANI